jgi:hypothetical protein
MLWSEKPYMNNYILGKVLFDNIILFFEYNQIQMKQMKRTFLSVEKD